MNRYVHTKREREGVRETDNVYVMYKWTANIYCHLMGSKWYTVNQ